jgi:hypothetical protein
MSNIEADGSRTSITQAETPAISSTWIKVIKVKREKKDIVKKT